MSHKRLLRALALGIVSVVLFGCGSKPSSNSATPSAPTSSAKSQGQVIIGMSQEPDSLNPAISTLEVSRSVEYSVFEPLWTADDQGNFVPKLAASAPSASDASADGKTYTIKLRQGVKWHDGTPFTSKDVKATFELMQNPKVKVPNRNGFNQMSSIEAPDDNTIKFTLKAPYAAITTILADTYIMPASVLTKSQDMNTDPFNSKPIGTGPYKFAEWQRGQYVAVTANPDYWGGAPKIGKAIYKIVPDRKVLFTQLTTGEVDIIADSLGISEENVPAAKAIPALQVENLTSNFYEHIVPNLSNPILADVNVRRAMKYATDMKPILDTVLFGLHKQADDYIPMSNWAYNPNITKYPFDLSKAKSTLDQAGWVAGADGIRAKNGQRLSVTVASTTGNAIRAQIEQMLQQQWKAAGIELKINNMDSSALFGDFMIQSKFEMLLMGQFVNPDPDLFSYPTFDSTQIPKEKNQGMNYGMVKNPDIDKALEHAQVTLDQAQRKADYATVQAIYTDQVLDFPIYYKAKIFGWQKKLQGIKLNPNVLTPTWNIAQWQMGS